MKAGEAGSRIFEESKSDKLLRQFSMNANAMVSCTIGDKMGPCTAVIFILNSLTGLSLLTLPYGFSKSGLLVGSLTLFVCMALSFVTATFMCEALTIANALTYEDAESKTIEEQGPELRKKLHDQKVKTETEPQGPLKQKLLTDKRADTIAVFKDEVRRHGADSEFKIRERVELGAMGEQVLQGGKSRNVAKAIYVVILSYTYGTASALVVTVNQSLAHTVCSVVALADPSAVCNENRAYNISVVVTFLMTLPLCFSDLQKTKKFTMGIMVLRSIAIFTLIIVGTYKSFVRWQNEGMEPIISALAVYRPEYTMSVFGNAVFLFGMHHYIPSMIAPLEPQIKAPKVIATAFCSCYLLIILVCATAIVAFGEETHATCSTEPGGHFCTVQPLYNLNFAPLDWAGGALAVFLLAYPAMAIASIPIAAITTRNTMARWLGLPPCDSENPYTRSNVSLILVVLVPPFVVALITKDVQAVIKYVGGYAGLTVASLCPLIMVVRCRQALELTNEREFVRPLKSPFAGLVGYFLVAVFYVVALALVTKQLFFDPPPAR